MVILILQSSRPPPQKNFCEFNPEHLSFAIITSVTKYSPKGGYMYHYFLRPFKLFFALYAAFFSANAAQAFSPDHYLSYTIMSFFEPNNVFLKDQFIEGNFIVYKPLKLLNPSDKIHMLPDGTTNAVKKNNPKLHYIAYEVSWQNPNPQTRLVKISNQFENSELAVYTYPDRMLVPAGKRHRALWPPVPDPVLISPSVSSLNRDEVGINGTYIPIPEGSHYLCYRTEDQNFDTMGILRDQFMMTDFNVLRRTHICNPAIKRHNDKVYETDIADRENHLACYEIDATDLSRRVLTNDQFGARRSLVMMNNEVCVPTVKTEITPEPTICGEIDADGLCPTTPNCPINTICQPDPSGSVNCICL
jgi:hypothetical protein